MDMQSLTQDGTTLNEKLDGWDVSGVKKLDPEEIGALMAQRRDQDYVDAHNGTLLGHIKSFFFGERKISSRYKAYWDEKIRPYK